MMSRRRILVLGAYVTLDLLVVVASFVVAVTETADWGGRLPRVATIPPGVLLPVVSPIFPVVLFTLVMTPVLVLELALHGFYETRRGTRYSQEFFGVFRAVLVAAVVTVVVDFLLFRLDVPRSFVLFHSVLVIAGLFTWRYLKRKYVEHLVTGGYRRTRALIVGAGRLGRYLGMILKGKEWLGVNVAGYLDDRYGLEEDETGEILGRICEFEQVVRDHGIQEVYITIPSERKIVPRLVEASNELGVAVKVVPEMYDMIASEVKFENVGSIPVMRLCVPALRPRQLAAKRVLELALTLPMLILLAPLMGLIALAVRLDSEGPIFYRAVVLGKGGRPVTIYKFRSMFRDADSTVHREYLERLVTSNRPADEEKGIYKLSDDDRITRVGRFLRKYSLDELPQLWNVVRGDISLVGPRPPLSYEYHHYDEYHKKRLLVKPGVTGLWQVSGKSRLSFESMIMLDLLYINEWSIWLDLKIMLDTIPVILRGDNV
jgi:exopolysaccharide biosynthesis polyprenyl glycosylphosphotransferase